MARERFSAAEARRIALAAQGLDRPRPQQGITAAHVARVIRRLGLLQLDFVNVLVPAHYLVLFARLGSFERALLPRIAYKQRDFLEQWAHEASLVPADCWPLLAPRRQAHRVRSAAFQQFLAEHRDWIEGVLQRIAVEGAKTAESFPDPEGISPDVAGSWYGTVARAVLEYHFARGTLAVAERKSNMARAYDLPERVVPAEHFRRAIHEADAERELLRRAARAHGIGTAADIADYYRMRPTHCRERLQELVDAGELRRVSVEGWDEPAYLFHRARLPRRVACQTFLSPFDPVVWFRPRARRLFDFDYRIEIYTPAAQRKWGYYVLPFLLNDRIVGRFDLKADRTEGSLVVRSAHLEPGAHSASVAQAALAELHVLKDWLGLQHIVVQGHGNLAARLARASLSSKRTWPK